MLNQTLRIVLQKINHQISVQIKELKFKKLTKGLAKLVEILVLNTHFPTKKTMGKNHTKSYRSFQ